jgi:hypothetical protein
VQFQPNTVRDTDQCADGTAYCHHDTRADRDTDHSADGTAHCQPDIRTHPDAHGAAHVAGRLDGA